MTKETYQEALNAAIKDLAKLMGEREELDTKREELDRNIFQLREGLFGLAILCGTDTNQLAKEYPELFPDLISPDLGLTDAVRKAMASKRNFVSPVEVKDRLAAMGFDITKYKNILASIHTILKRLLASDEVEAGTRDEKVVYRWNPVNEGTPLPAHGAGRQSFFGSLSPLAEMAIKTAEEAEKKNKK
ncbi:MAG TPA: hypothetical protein VF544_17805 [Pyrinomonadaceae bacterium]|jgi:hypothetical protein